IREGVGFEITHVCNGLVFIDRAKSGKGEMPPCAISFFPIERSFPTLFVHRHPTEREPEFRLLISSGFNESKVCAEGNQTRAEGKFRDECAMSRSFIVVGKIATIMTNSCNCFVEIDKCHRRRRVGFLLRAFSKNWMQRILREDMLDIGNEQFLMLLLMLNAECDDRFDFVQ